MVRFGLVLYFLQILEANIKNSVNGNKLFTESASCKELLNYVEIGAFKRSLQVVQSSNVESIPKKIKI